MFAKNFQHDPINVAINADVSQSMLKYCVAFHIEMPKILLPDDLEMDEIMFHI